MDASIKARWVAALREESRHQGTGQLRDEYGAQCCLDVLCELAVNAKVIPAPVYEDLAESYIYHFTTTDLLGEIVQSSEFGILPYPVANWAGIGDLDPAVRGLPLSHWNDQSGMTFAEIATMIEESDL
jgi:hypothetical protein